MLDLCWIHIHIYYRCSSFHAMSSAETNTEADTERRNICLADRVQICIHRFDVIYLFCLA